LEARRLLAPYLPEDVAKHLPLEQVDVDGAAVFALLSPIGYNTNLVKPEDAPKSFADLLDPRWKGKIVKGQPDYSGTILHASALCSFHALVKEKPGRRPLSTITLMKSDPA
jgi:ABC-type Fe3+ transport system substrate-binding protein